MQYGEILTTLIGFFGSILLTFLGIFGWFRRGWTLHRRTRHICGLLLVGSGALLLIASLLLYSGKVTVHYTVSGPFSAFYESKVLFCADLLLSGAVACAVMVLSATLRGLFHDWTMSALDAMADVYLAEAFVLVPALLSAAVHVGVSVWLAGWLWAAGHQPWVLASVLLGIVIAAPEYLWLKPTKEL